MHQELKKNQKKGSMNEIVRVAIDTVKEIGRGIVTVIGTGTGNVADIEKGWFLFIFDIITNNNVDMKHNFV